MLALKGHFDGKIIQITDRQSPALPQDVIIIFPDTDQDSLQADIYSAAREGKSFDFLNDEPDLYSDEDLKVRYK